jgi:thiosulfate reductase/polysulfide reductase chain A
MEIIEVSRRRFLQGSVGLCIYAMGGCSFKDVQGTESGETTHENIPYLCNMCRNKCAGFATVKAGKLVKLDPNPWFPKSRNMLCPKGHAGIDLLYDPDRLKYPLIRIGERGDGRYRRVTWDEAFEYIASKLSKIFDEERDNRSTLAYCNGEGFNKDEYIQFFGGKIGSANFLDEGSICLNTKLGATVLTIGDTGEPDVAGSDYLIISGANRFESLITPDSIDMLHAEGQRVVVLDPRCTVTALKADMWFPIYPGTDLAFCLALTWIAFKEELYDRTFAERNMIDLDRYRDHILSENYTPLWAEKKTGIPAEKIEKVAKEFFAAQTPLYYPGRRSVWSLNDFQFRRALILLNALAGSIDRKGGIIYGKPFSIPYDYWNLNLPFYSNARDRFDLEGIVYGSKQGGSWLNFREKILKNETPYPVRALFVRKHNVMQNMPNISKTRAMLEKMDLIVVMDTMPSDTAVMADVILPECTYLEREDLVQAFNRLEPSLALRNKTIAPMYESRSMQDILKGLAVKLSRPLFEVSRRWDKDLQETIAQIGEKRAYMEGGYDLTELYRKDISSRNREIIVKAYGEEAYRSLKTKGIWYPDMEVMHRKKGHLYYEYYSESKRYYSVKDKLKIRCRLEKMEKDGYDAMPAWHESYDFKPSPGKYRLLTGRYVTVTQTSTANNAMLAEFMRTNHLWINDKEAKKLGVKQGTMVRVKSSVGEVVLPAYPTNRIAPYVVFFAHGFGMENEGLTIANHRGASDNVLIEDRMEKIYGCAAMHETDVVVEAEGGDE